jgi:hypothetical protein
MSATNHSNDYFRLVDLNPTGVGVGSVGDPRDPRGQCWFGVVAQGQRLSIEMSTTGWPQGMRVLYTFDYEYFTGVGVIPPTVAKPHGILQMNGQTDQDQMYIGHHEREFVALWIDPTGVQPTTGQQVQISVKAWRRD